MKNPIKSVAVSYFKSRLPRELIIKGSDRLLIISPHPDDESIGCGQLLMKYGKQCDVILISDGECANPEWTTEQTSRVRNKEFDDAMTYANVKQCYKLHIPNRCIDEKKAAKHIKRIIKGDCYDFIFVPGRNDGHRDHIDTYNAFVRALFGSINIRARVLEYEVWSPLQKANRYIIFSDFSDKDNILNIYVSQLMHVDYKGLSNGINHYRGITLAKCDYYAETFYEEGKVIRIVEYFRSKPIHMIKKKLRPSRSKG